MNQPITSETSISQESVLTPSPIKGKFSGRQVNNLSTNNRIVVAISSIGIGILFFTLLIGSGCPMALGGIAGLALGAYCAFSFIAASRKANKVDDYRTTYAQQNFGTNEPAVNPISKEKEEEENKNKDIKFKEFLESFEKNQISAQDEKANELKKLTEAFENEISQIFNIGTEEEAELYLNNWRTHYDAVIEISSKIESPSSPLSRGIEGMKTMMSYLFNHNDRMQCLKQDEEAQNLPRYHETTGSLRCREVHGLKVRTGIPLFIKIMEKKELEVLKENWLKHQDKWKLNEITITSYNFEPDATEVKKHILSRS